MYELVRLCAKDAIPSTVMFAFDDRSTHLQGPTLRAALKNAMIHIVSMTNVTINAISCQVMIHHVS